MRHQAIRTTALMLGVLLAAAAPAQAGTITFGELVRRVGANGQLRPGSEVRLRVVAQSGSASAQSGSTQSGTTSSSPSDPQAAGSQQVSPSGTSDVSAPASANASADPTLSQSGSQVQTVDLGDVTGTVCDCGEIPPIDIPKAGGFPWWALAGIPLICVSGICFGDEEPPNGPPCCDEPPPPPIPEPVSLLLFGSGLLAVGAGARRRRSSRRLEDETLSATTEEV